MIATWATRLTCRWTWRNRGKRFHSFAQAELSSRYDMLAAANRTLDPELAAAFLRHAADEARHARVFHLRAKDLGYERELDADFEHLYARLGERDFLAFVHRGETRALRQFAVWRKWLGEGRDAVLLDSVLPDEIHHAKYTGELLVAGSGRKVAFWELRRSWLRSGRALTGVVYTFLTTFLYLTLAPLALWVRF
jgi:hypothetical protein